MADGWSVVTGTTSGIGPEVARGLARAGRKVVLHGRDRARTEAAAASVRNSVPGAILEVVTGDLAVRADVDRIGDELAKLGPISALVQNAAVVPHERILTAEGVESAFAVNVLAPFLLSRRLAENNRGGRVVMYFGGNPGVAFDPDDLQFARGKYDGWEAYCRSKIALAALTLELARRAPDPAYLLVLPGMVNTEGMRSLPGVTWWIGQTVRFWGRTPEQGARTPVWAATAPELAGVTGKSFGNLIGSGWRNPLALPEIATAPATGARVYEAVSALAGV